MLRGLYASEELADNGLTSSDKSAEFLFRLAPHSVACPLLAPFRIIGSVRFGIRSNRLGLAEAAHLRPADDIPVRLQPGFGQPSRASR